MSKAICLLYHDVVADGQYDSSGFSGSGPAEYKLSVESFEAHLSAIKSALAGPAVGAPDFADYLGGEVPVLFTFDDGGVSAYDIIAPALERFGWRGCFFITTDRIDSPAFLSREQIKDLYERGHSIGSHSCSHPKKISNLSRGELLAEWRDSLKVLSEIIDRRVTIASIPGGFYSAEVADSAFDSGVETLFTSEPQQSIQRRGTKMIVGRFGLQRGMPASIAARFVSGDRFLRLRVYAYWNLKKAAKYFAGPLYASIRTHVLSRR